MAALKPFVLDGTEYNVHVTKLTRKFSVLDTNKTGRTQGGGMYRDIIGTYYNYAMTVIGKSDDKESFDAFWDAISSPVESHECAFPYNQEMLSQKMYVTSGEQDIRYLKSDSTHWGEININFVAMSPKVVP